jgi:hypothetical protein
MLDFAFDFVQLISIFLLLDLLLHVVVKIKDTNFDLCVLSTSAKGKGRQHDEGGVSLQVRRHVSW